MAELLRRVETRRHQPRRSAEEHVDDDAHCTPGFAAPVPSAWRCGQGRCRRTARCRSLTRTRRVAPAARRLRRARRRALLVRAVRRQSGPWLAFAPSSRSPTRTCSRRGAVSGAALPRGGDGPARQRPLRPADLAGGLHLRPLLRRLRRRARPPGGRARGARRHLGDDDDRVAPGRRAAASGCRTSSLPAASPRG